MRLSFASFLVVAGLLGFVAQDNNPSGPGWQLQPPFASKTFKVKINDKPSKAEVAKITFSGHEISSCLGESLYNPTQGYRVRVPVADKNFKATFLANDNAHVHLRMSQDPVAAKDQMFLVPDADKLIKFSGEVDQVAYFVDDIHTLRMENSEGKTQKWWAEPPNVVPMGFTLDSVDVKATNRSMNRGAAAAISDYDFAVQLLVNAPTVLDIEEEPGIPPFEIWTENERLVPRYAGWIRSGKYATFVAIVPFPPTAPKNLFLQVGGQSTSMTFPAPLQTQVPLHAPEVAEIKYQGAPDHAPICIHGPLKTPWEATTERTQGASGTWKVPMNKQDKFAQIRQQPPMNFKQVTLAEKTEITFPTGRIVPGDPTHIIATSDELKAIVTDSGAWMPIGNLGDIAEIAYLTNLSSALTGLTSVPGSIVTTPGSAGAGNLSNLFSTLSQLFGNAITVASLPTRAVGGNGNGGGGNPGMAPGGQFAFIATNQPPKNPKDLPELPKVEISDVELKAFRLCFKTCKCPYALPGSTIEHAKDGDGCPDHKCRPRSKLTYIATVKVTIKNIEWITADFHMSVTDDLIWKIGSSSEQIVIFKSRGENSFKLSVEFRPKVTDFEYMKDLYVWTYNQVWDTSGDKPTKKWVEETFKQPMSGIARKCKVTPPVAVPLPPKPKKEEIQKKPGDNWCIGNDEDGTEDPIAEVAVAPDEILEIPSGGEAIVRIHGTGVIQSVAIPPNGRLHVDDGNATVQQVRTNSGVLMNIHSTDKPPERGVTVGNGNAETTGCPTQSNGPSNTSRTPPIVVAHRDAPGGSTSLGTTPANGSNAPEPQRNDPSTTHARVLNGAGQEVANVSSYNGMPGTPGAISVEVVDEEGNVIYTTSVPGYAADIQYRFDPEDAAAGAPVKFVSDNIGDYIKALEQTFSKNQDFAKGKWVLKLENQQNVTLPSEVVLPDNIKEIRKLEVEGKCGVPGQGKVSPKVVRKVAK